MSEIKNILLELIKFDTQNSDNQDERDTLRGETLEALKFIKKRLEEQGIEMETLLTAIYTTYATGRYRKLKNKDRHALKLLAEKILKKQCARL